MFFLLQSSFLIFYNNCFISTSNCDQICQNWLNLYPVKRYTFHHHSVATAINQQCMYVSLSMVHWSALLWLISEDSLMCTNAQVILEWHWWDWRNSYLDGHGNHHRILAFQLTNLTLPDSFIRPSIKLTKITWNFTTSWLSSTPHDMITCGIVESYQNDG